MAVGSSGNTSAVSSGGSGREGICDGASSSGGNDAASENMVTTVTTTSAAAEGSSVQLSRLMRAHSSIAAALQANASSHLRGGALVADMIGLPQLISIIPLTLPGSLSPYCRPPEETSDGEEGGAASSEFLYSPFQVSALPPPHLASGCNYHMSDSYYVLYMYKHTYIHTRNNRARIRTRKRTQAHTQAF